MLGGYFLTVKDLMRLTGNKNYSHAAKVHREIRLALGAEKRKLTVKEYCSYEGVSYSEIWNYLRG